jgi:hypothetical protein
MSFESTLAAFARLDADDLARPWKWRGAEMDVRNALYWLMGEAQEAVARAAAGPHPESRRILALAQRAFGDLRGLLVGLPADLLDRAPAAGEWTLRETLRHVLWIERRYALQSAYAIERADADPVRIPEARLPAREQIDASGDIAAVLARLAAMRAETNARLGDVPATALTRPTIWVHYSIDLRFRLHRFAIHLAEHTIQCEKTLAALGWHPTEGRRIVRHLSALHGELDGLAATGEVANLEALSAARLASIVSPPAP